MVGYVNAFWLLLTIATIITPLSLLMRTSQKSSEPVPVLHVE